ncbi:MAG: hypothetical protein AB6733_05075 [Clostridiaceae bacterium]
MSDKKTSTGAAKVKVGNFTLGAVKAFEENIVNQENYLEKFNASLKGKNTTKK